MQSSKLLFFILIVLIVAPISSSEQQEEKEECSIIDEVFGECGELPQNYTIPEPRETTTKECSITDDGKERCVEKTIKNGTYSYEKCIEDGVCLT
jgi:hypothetical protein